MGSPTSDEHPDRCLALRPSQGSTRPTQGSNSRDRRDGLREILSANDLQYVAGSIVNARGTRPDLHVWLGLGCLSILSGFQCISPSLLFFALCLTDLYFKLLVILLVLLLHKPGAH